MAAVTPQLLETFFCSVCLGVLNEPVTIPCGHSYCMSCIQASWDVNAKRGLCSCPQCRKIFTSRPDLMKNTMLAGLVEQLNAVPAAPADHCCAGPEDVACDFCTGRKLKAVKSCLVCLASYCEKHLQPHHDVAPLKKHKLVDPSKKLPENICSRHGEVMKIFCRTDQQIICFVCFMGEHEGHDTVSAAAERTERQRELEASRLNIQQRIRDREEGLELLQQEEEKIDKAQKDCEEILDELRNFTLYRSNDVTHRVFQQHRDELNGVDNLMKKLRKEIEELKRSDAELEEVSHTGNLNQFLKKRHSVSPLSESADSFSIHVRPPGCFGNFTRTLFEVRSKLEDALGEKWANVFLTVAEVEVLLSQ